MDRVKQEWWCIVQQNRRYHLWWQDAYKIAGGTHYATQAIACSILNRQSQELGIKGKRYIVKADKDPKLYDWPF